MSRLRAWQLVKGLTEYGWWKLPAKQSAILPRFATAGRPRNYVDEMGFRSSGVQNLKLNRHMLFPCSASTTEIGRHTCAEGTAFPSYLVPGTNGRPWQPIGSTRTSGLAITKLFGSGKGPLSACWFLFLAKDCKR